MTDKSPLEIATEWYRPEEIHHAINSRDAEPIPEDHTSMEFAEWLTHQYRLAMMKGFDLARRPSDPAIDQNRPCADNPE